MSNPSRAYVSPEITERSNFYRSDVRVHVRVHVYQKKENSNFFTPTQSVVFGKTLVDLRARRDPRPFAKGRFRLCRRRRVINYQNPHRVYDTDAHCDRTSGVCGRSNLSARINVVESRIPEGSSQSKIRTPSFTRSKNHKDDHTTDFQFDFSGIRVLIGLEKINNQ